MTTTAFKLGLPTDIPWRRICVTEDMIDTAICDGVNPPRWASSIAVFKYVPPQEYQENDEYTITYLKVAVSITGFVPRDKEIEGRLDWEGMTAEEIADVESLLNEYQPCTGALVQISVSAEEGGDVSAAQQPFFLDFEPKKRELYEMATDTMERSSRSLQSLSVGKSGRTTQSLEVLDIDMGGGGFGAQGTYGGTGGGFTYQAPSGQWGTKQVASNESAVARTVDNSTERRETHAFTTQISQLYHLLDSYHLGTNRAVFLLEPRPHVVEQTSGFVQGPRPIDGVQEFFLVVASAKEDGEYCVAVRLDTAHYTEEDILDYEKRQDSLALAVNVAPPAKDDPEAAFTDYDYMDVTPGGDRRYKCYEKRVEMTENYIVAESHAGFRIDVATSSGYDIVAESESYGGRSVAVSADRESLTARVWATARKCYNDGGAFCLNCPDTWHARSAHSNMSLLLYLISKEPTIKVGTRKYLLITTRGLCCCEVTPTGTFGKPGIVDVISVDDLITKKGEIYGLAPKNDRGTYLSVHGKGRDGKTDRGANAESDPRPQMTIREANALAKLFRAELQEAAASRKAATPTPVLLHDFFLNRLQRKLRSHPGTRKRLDEVADDLPDRQKLAKYLNLDARQLRRRDVLSLTTADLAKATQTDARHAAEIRLGLAGLRMRDAGGKPGNDDGKLKPGRSRHKAR